MPTTSIDGPQLEFNLEKYEGSNIYLIHDTLLEIRLKIIDVETKAVPVKTLSVAPRNNILHTLFDKVSLYLNDTLITVDPSNYAYKAYILNALTYSFISKDSHLQSQGFFSDEFDNFDETSIEKNSGFGQRCTLFRKKFNTANDYREDGALFFGRLYHELSSCQTGLPPGVKAKFLLTKNNPLFVIQSAASDTKTYAYKILSANLYVPVAQLSLSVYNELSTIMARKHDPKSVAIHFRRLEIRPISLPHSKQDYYSTPLFTQNDLPCKIIITFVEADAFLGSHHKNPFKFNRLWSVQVPELENDANITHLRQERDIFDQRFARLEKKLEDFMQFHLENEIQKQTKLIGKGKGKGKSSQKNNLDSNVQAQDVTSNSITKQFEDILRKTLTMSYESENLRSNAIPNKEKNQNKDHREPLPSTSRASSLHSFHSEHQRTTNRAYSFATEDTTSDNEDVQGLVTKTVFIKNIELLLNSTPIDQIDDQQTEDECLKTYWRMFNSNGQVNSLFSNSISYEDFRGGYFFAVYDLSTSGKANSNFVIPSIRIGHLRIRYTFF